VALYIQLAQELVSETVAMDPEYLASLFHRHAPALVLYGRQWSDCAEDIVQEAFRKLSEQDPLPTPVRPWLFRVARNAAISAQRRSRRRRETAKTMQSWFERVDDQLEIDEAVQALKAPVQELPNSNTDRDVLTPRSVIE
jgi:RNA polymerase sigma factor (sigma-70 family)